VDNFLNIDCFKALVERSRKTGCLKSIINAIKSKVSSFFWHPNRRYWKPRLATNLVAGALYLSIALPGRMYSPVYPGMGYSTLNLLRGIEETDDEVIKEPVLSYSFSLRECKFCCSQIL